MTPASLQDQCRRYIASHPHAVLAAATHGIYHPGSMSDGEQHDDTSSSSFMDRDANVRVRVTLAPHIHANHVRSVVATTATGTVDQGKRCRECVLYIVGKLCEQLARQLPHDTAVVKCARGEFGLESAEEAKAVQYIVALFRSRGFISTVESRAEPTDYYGECVTYWVIRVTR